jgi:hypothetical protein
MALTAQQQAGMLRNRNRRITRQILQSLTRWTTGLSVEAGDYVSSESDTTPWIAQNSGVTGPTAPTGQGSVNDGVVTWVRADIPSLLQFKFSGAPTPA